MGEAESIFPNPSCVLYNICGGPLACFTFSSHPGGFAWYLLWSRRIIVILSEPTNFYPYLISVLMVCSS